MNHNHKLQEVRKLPLEEKMKAFDDREKSQLGARLSRLIGQPCLPR